MAVLKRYTGTEWEAVGAAPSGSSGQGLVDFAQVMRTTNAGGGSTYVLNNTSWAVVDATNLSITLTATTGDVIEVGLSARIDSEAIEVYLDGGIIVGGALQSFVSGLGTGNTTRGPQAWTGALGAVTYAGGSVFKALAAGDISGGTVTIRLYFRTHAGGNKSLNCDTNMPVHFWARNMGQPL